MAESFDTDAKDSPDEKIVEQGQDNSKDGNNCNESYVPANDDSLFLVREDYASNNVGLDDILGTDLFSFDDDALGVDGTSDNNNAQSRESPADQLGADIKDAPTGMCADKEEYPQQLKRMEALCLTLGSPVCPARDGTDLFALAGPGTRESWAPMKRATERERETERERKQDSMRRGYRRMLEPTQAKSTSSRGSQLTSQLLFVA